MAVADQEVINSIKKVEKNKLRLSEGLNGVVNFTVNS